jgi:rhomboid family GlyGly-CTERM serine protease
MADVFVDMTIGRMAGGISRMSKKASTFRMPPDMLFLLGIIGLCNFHLITGGSCSALIFRSDKVAAGEWFRLATHPFAHVSWYHFLLDAGAFLLLYTGLNETRSSRRLLTVGICGAGGLLAPLVCAPEIYSRGLCGLSGVAHGLMAYSGLEMMREKTAARIGFVCLAIVVVKSIYEAVTGTMFFSFLLFGLCGIPIAVCHAGGVLGGMIAFLLFGRASCGGGEKHLKSGH